MWFLMKSPTRNNQAPIQNIADDICLTPFAVHYCHVKGAVYVGIVGDVLIVVGAGVMAGEVMYRVIHWFHKRG